MSVLCSSNIQEYIFHGEYCYKYQCISVSFPDIHMYIFHLYILPARQLRHRPIPRDDLSMRRNVQRVNICQTVAQNTRAFGLCDTDNLRGGFSPRLFFRTSKEWTFTWNALVNSLIVYNPRTSENPSCSFESRVLVSDSILVAWK